MAAQSKEAYEFRRQVEALKQFRGRGTELISVLITPGYAISDVVAKLRDEYGQASNIKSKATQLNVQSALQKVMQYLKTLGHRPPANGIAIFCGNLSESEGKTDIRLYSVIPPTPLGTQFYRCDSAFVLEPLEELMGQSDCYGLVVLDGKEATVAILKGKTTKIVKKLHTTAHQKVSKGGQCLHQDTLVQKADGGIVPIKEVREGERILSADLNTFKTLNAECSAIYSRSSNTAYELSFEHPQASVKVTPEHLFFVLSDGGFEERPAAGLEEGDAVALLLRSRIAGKNAVLPMPQEYEAVSTDAGKILRDARLEKRLLQKEVASALGWHQADVSELERVKNITSCKLHQLIGFYGLSTECSAMLTVQKQRFSMPQELTPEVAQIVGYVLGDGTFDGNRVTMFDEDAGLIGHYRALALSSFCVEGIIRHREEKGYYELRLHNKWLAQYLQQAFDGLGGKTKVPTPVQTSENRVVAGFLRGLFDAEATVSSARIALAMANRTVVMQSALLLARFGILCSTYPKHSKFAPQFGLDIIDKRSLQLYRQFVGFSSHKKARKLEEVISLKSDTSKSLTVPVRGPAILSTAGKCGLKPNDFLHCPDFIRGNKTMGFTAFEKNVVSVIERRHKQLSEAPRHSNRELRMILRKSHAEVGQATGISASSVFNAETGASQNAGYTHLVGSYLASELERQAHECRKLLDFCALLLDSDLTFCTLKQKRAYTPSPQEKFFDLTVPGAQKFVADRLVVHNSAARYDRLHTEGVEYYYKRIGEAMDAYVGIKNFKGVIVGGPGPAKEDFLRMHPFHHELKVLAIVDTGYTEEQGLRELLEKSEGVISEQESVKEKRLINDFMKAVTTGGLATYGLAEIQEALESGKANKLLVSEGLELHELHTMCTQCGTSGKEITQEPTVTAQTRLKCAKCGARPKVESDKDISAWLQEIAAAHNIEVELISQETHEGLQFFGTFHGLGAFLRYK
ncbi:MAG: LAGLIDADG family homing endonuclease [Candidatus Micrarchaeota archaeon]